MTQQEGNLASACKRNKQQRQKVKDERVAQVAATISEPDWTGKCEVCGASPIVPETGMCGPCTFGEADTVGGNW